MQIAHEIQRARLNKDNFLSGEKRLLTGLQGGCVMWTYRADSKEPQSDTRDSEYCTATIPKADIKSKKIAHVARRASYSIDLD